NPCIVRFAKFKSFFSPISEAILTKSQYRYANSSRDTLAIDRRCSRICRRRFDYLAARRQPVRGIWAAALELVRLGQRYRLDAALRDTAYLYRSGCCGSVSLRPVEYRC